MARYDPLLPSFQTLLPSLSLANSLANRRNCECQPQYDPKVNQDVIIHSDRCNERHAQPGRAAGYIEFRRSSQQFSPREELSNSPLGDSRLSPIPNNTIEQGRSPLTSASTIASRSPRSAHEGARQAFIKVEDDEDEAVSGANLPHGRSAQLHYSPNNPSQRSHGSSSQYERPQASFQSSYQRSDHAEYSHRPAPRLAFNTPLDPNHSRPLVPSRSPSPQSATTGVRCDCANCIPSSQSPTPNPDTQDQEHGSMGWRDGDEPLGREDIDMERKTGRLRSSNYGSELRWDERERTLYQDPRYQTASGPGGLSLTGGPYMPETQRMRPWVDSRHEYRQDHMVRDLTLIDPIYLIDPLDLCRCPIILCISTHIMDLQRQPLVPQALHGLYQLQTIILPETLLVLKVSKRQ